MICLSSLILIVLSCKESNKEKCYGKQMSYYKSNKLFYQESDSLYNYYKKINGSKLDQQIIFRKDGSILQYIFYNQSINEPRFIINYHDDFQSSVGKPIYLESNDFSKGLMIGDSFAVYIHVATPPENEVKISILEIESKLATPITNYSFDSNNVVLFVGRKKNVIHEYQVVSFLKDVCTNFPERIDTARFSIK